MEWRRMENDHNSLYSLAMEERGKGLKERENETKR